MSRYVKKQMIDRRVAYRIVYGQLAVAIIVGLLSWLIYDANVTKNAFLGAMLCWLASCFFAWKAFQFSGAQSSRKVLSALYTGMFGKFIIVIVGFILIFQWIDPLVPLALLLGFGITQSTAWFVPLLFGTPKN